MNCDEGVQNVLNMLDAISVDVDRYHIDFVDVFCEKGFIGLSCLT